MSRYMNHPQTANTWASRALLMEHKACISAPTHKTCRRPSDSWTQHTVIITICTSCLHHHDIYCSLI